MSDIVTKPFKSLKFDRKHDLDFFKTLSIRVKDYFETNNIDRTGGSKMVIKTIFMLALYFVPFALLFVNLFENSWWTIVLWLFMGLGMAGLGLSVMHDACHSSYSSNPNVNNLVSKIMYLIGGSPLNWKIQHNVLHHTYTNVDGYDEDITSTEILRFSPHLKRKKIHKYQHYYAWFFYSLMTIYWSTTKDFSQLKRYIKMGLVGKKASIREAWTNLITGKVLYYVVFLILPLIFSPAPWYVTLVGYIVMHMLAGLMLSCIFQPAHVMPSSEYPLPDGNGCIKNNWAIHQLLTTTNFSPKSNIFAWFIGGLNYQIEHHLFPNICHVHYKKLSKIVEKTAKEFNLPYHSERTYIGAITKHAQMLRLLGRNDMVPA